jgi:hypothetical protein
MIRGYLETVAAEAAAAGRERDALERSFERFKFKFGKRTWKRATSTIAREFLDTNVLVYAYDPSDRRRQQTAQGLVRRALAGEIAISTQVLGSLPPRYCTRCLPLHLPGM